MMAAPAVDVNWLILRISDEFGSLQDARQLAGRTVIVRHADPLESHAAFGQQLPLG